MLAYISQFFSLVYFSHVGLFIVSYIVHCFVFVVFSVINLRFGGYTNLQLKTTKKSILVLITYLKSVYPLKVLPTLYNTLKL